MSFKIDNRTTVRSAPESKKDSITRYNELKNGLTNSVTGLTTNTTYTQPQTINQPQVSMFQTSSTCKISQETHDDIY